MFVSLIVTIKQINDNNSAKANPTSKHVYPINPSSGLTVEDGRDWPHSTYEAFRPCSSIRRACISRQQSWPIWQPLHTRTICERQYGL